MEAVKKAYSEILNTLRKHKGVIIFDIDELERISKYHLFGIELKEKYGLNINPKILKSLDWNKFGEYMAISWYGGDTNRDISWSDDDTQPNDELLLSISFPTGAYLFGNENMLHKDYPVEFFQKFFNELKKYNPKYIDTHNSSLYFSMENAGKVFNKFNDILKKYHEMNREDIRKRKIKEMKEGLKRLQKGQISGGFSF